jgi:hypothetical protein
MRWPAKDRELAFPDTYRSQSHVAWFALWTDEVDSKHIKNHMYSISIYFQDLKPLSSRQVSEARQRSPEPPDVERWWEDPVLARIPRSRDCAGKYPW